MIQERPLPRFRSSRTALIVISFATLAALVAWVAARYDNFGALPAVLFVIIGIIGYFYYHRRRCPECRSRLSVRRDYIGGTQSYRLLLDCARCQTAWNTGEIGDEDGRGQAPPLRKQWSKFSLPQKAMWLIIPCALLFMLSECRPGSRLYGFSMVGREGHTVMDFALARIVFQGIRHPGKSDGDIQVNGWGIETAMVNEGSMPFEVSSRRGVTKVKYAGYAFSLRDSGRLLEYGTNRFRLGPEKPTIMLMRNGMAQVITNDAKYRE